MSEKNSEQKKTEQNNNEKKTNVRSQILSYIIGFAFSSTTILSIVTCYINLNNRPKIQLDQKLTQMSVTEDFLTIKARMYGQLVVYKGNEILITIRLENYIENETVYFEEKKADFSIVGEDLLNTFAQNLKKSIVEKANEEDKDRIEKIIKIEASFLIFAEYQTLASSHKNRACYVEEDGLLVGIPTFEYNSILQDRLYEYKVDLQSFQDPAVMDAEVARVVDAVLPEVNAHLWRRFLRIFLRLLWL